MPPTAAPVVIAKPVEDCVCGVPVILHKIKIDADCDGVDVECILSKEIVMEIQPFVSRQGHTEISTKSGAYIEAEYEFWYHPRFNDDEYLKSGLLADKDVDIWLIEWQGEKYKILRVDNWTAPCCKSDEVTMQVGLLSLYETCLSEKTAIIEHDVFEIDEGRIL